MKKFLTRTLNVERRMLNVRSPLVLSVLLVPCVLSLSCKSVDPSTGQRTFDPAKTEQAKAAIQPVITGAVRRLLINNPQHAPEYASYIRQAGRVFCQMDAAGRFEPSFLIEQLDLILTGSALADPRYDYLLTIKDAAIALYRINYAQRLTAELPPDAWARQTASLFCSAIDQGLKSANQPGLD